MSTALIIYGSTTGNTESAAETIQGHLEGKGFTVTLKDVAQSSVDDLKTDYDVCLLGSSTWGDDEIEFQEDFEGFYEAMDMDLAGKKFAVFGCGDSSYTYFCGAVDALDEKIKELGGALVCESLKIDGDPETDEIEEWAQGVVDALS